MEKLDLSLKEKSLFNKAIFLASMLSASLAGIAILYPTFRFFGILLALFPLIFLVVLGVRTKFDQILWGAIWGYVLCPILFISYLVIDFGSYLRSSPGGQDFYLNTIELLVLILASAYIIFSTRMVFMIRKKTKIIGLSKIFEVLLLLQNALLSIFLMLLLTNKFLLFTQDSNFMTSFASGLFAENYIQLYVLIAWIILFFSCTTFLGYSLLLKRERAE